MIRQMRQSDIAALREMEAGFEWNYGPDFMECLVAVDESDRPIMAIGAWQRAEVHLLSRPVDTPGMRLSMLHQLHEEMERVLFAKGVGEVVTWFDTHNKWGKLCAFTRRLRQLGWVQSSKVSWHRKVGLHG